MFFQLENKKSAYEARTGHALTALPHLHSHIEIVRVESGESVGFADSRNGGMNKGDLFVSFPNQIHYYDDKIRPVNHKILIVSPNMCPEFGSIFKTMVPESPILKNAADNKRIVSAMENVIECKIRGDEYSETEVRGSVLILMSELCRNMKLVKNAGYDTEMTKEIINYCYENYATDISLQSIADELHISRYYISHLFGQRLHIGFSDYINSLRVRSAAEMLKSGEKTITEIAYAVGYNSVRTFDRCFLKVRGMTPKEYRNKALQKKNASV